jgi:hypothetical protein
LYPYENEMGRERSAHWKEKKIATKFWQKNAKKIGCLAKLGG